MFNKMRVLIYLIIQRNVVKLFVKHLNVIICSNIHFFISIFSFNFKCFYFFIQFLFKHFFLLIIILFYKVILKIRISIMKGYQVIIALVNGMLGGVILILPVMAMQSGTVLSLLVILLTGFFSYYSCLLCLKHLGNHSDLDKAILEHFNNNKCVSITYDILVGVNLLFLLMLYFNLIVTQW